jgi:hypothetical protein
MGPTKARLWLGRVAAGMVLVLGIAVFTSFAETGSALLFLMAADGVLGSALLLFGVERPAHRLARPARLLGWAMMLAFTLVPTGLLYLPAVVVLCAAPAAFGSRIEPRTTPASAPP